MPPLSKPNGQKCRLDRNPLPESSKERWDYWYKVKPLSLTYQNASQLVQEADHGEEKLEMIKDIFESSFLDLQAGDISDNIFLERFFTVFSDVFFFRLTRLSFCRMRFISKNTSNWPKNQDRALGPVKGYAKDHRYDMKDVMSRITIYEQEDEDQRARAIAHLGTLAHEMIHSFFHVYTCLCKEKCAALVTENQGLTGHGLPWQRCAMTIEHVLKRSLGENATLSRARAMGKELVYRNVSAGDMPLRELGLKSEDVKHLMEFYRKLKTEKRHGGAGSSATTFSTLQHHNRQIKRV